MIDNGDGELSARGVLRAELTRQREQTGWTLAELADRSRYDASYLQRLEKGDRLGSLDAIGVLDRVYETGEHLSDLWRLAKKEDKQNRFQGFADLETEATGIEQFSISTVPGLLQTERYAEELLRTYAPDSEEVLAEQVRARINRQDRLTRPKALRYRGLLDESVLRRKALDPDVWTEQLERLISAAQEPNISLQVVPFGVGLHTLLGNSLQLLWLPSGRTVAYVESTWSGQLVAETEEMEHLRFAYDRLRDAALSPSKSLELLRTVLEDHTSCRTPGQT
ncbi:MULTISPECIES: helix-turn-helix domain-containing protein [unclassified Streptomyces]|uniref:helix-turn-helix domain-containing protein n=1 Tax=unclassified Streptomyces TaxID=2593676 RepID=UPI002E2B6989|nr:helix-turn-helix transcriptional regulator [Streptomyces sp. NBC_00223]